MGNKIVLTRSSRELVNNGFIGYGWMNVKFNTYSSTKNLLEQGFEANGINYGRKKKQIKRFFELKKDDIVAVPLSKVIAIGIVEGEKTFDDKSKLKFSANRIKVNFNLDNNGKIIYVPRKSFTNAFQSRLKIRQTVADLESFRDEIEEKILEIKTGKLLTWDEKFIKKEEEYENTFKRQLLKRLRTGKKLGLAAGGYGLEKLVEELMKINGYKAKIMPKNQSKGIDDIDIRAVKINEITGLEEVLLIQVKHHNNNTSGHGINQLAAHKANTDEMTTKILITTGDVNEQVKEKAEKVKILIIDGESLVDMIYQNLNGFTDESRRKLGIGLMPVLI